MQVTFLIDEGRRYIIDHVDFKGVDAVSEQTLRQDMVELEGKPYDADAIKRDRRSIVKAYSKVGGYIFQEAAGIPPNPEYLQIRVKKWFKREPGHVDLVYDISEGKR